MMKTTRDPQWVEIKFEGAFPISIRKVEKIFILNGSLDSTPSPSVKIQIMGGKVCFDM